MNNSARILLLPIALFLVFAPACKSLPTPVPTQEAVPTPKPTTVLTPAAGFTPEQCPKPEDKYLMLRYKPHTECTPACDCPMIEAPMPAIKQLGDEYIYQPDQVIGSFAPFAPVDDTVGLEIYGWFEEAVYAMETLPFEVPYSQITIQSCEPDGTLIVEIGGNVYELGPGQSWSGQSVRDGGEGCYYTSTTLITNAGLIPRRRFISAWSTHDENVFLELEDIYFYLGEAISATVRMIGGTAIDVSSICNPLLERKVGASWEPVGACNTDLGANTEPAHYLPGEMMAIALPTENIGRDRAYQFELTSGTYRLKFAYTYPEGNGQLVSPEFTVVDR